MNAKKIMGAVLVALLAAALFIGAGAAADEGKDFGTVFIYQNTTNSTDDVTEGEWINGNAKVVVTNGIVYPGVNFEAGTYKNGKDTAYFTYPTANYAVGATIKGTAYLVANGGNVYNASVITPDIKSAAKNVSIAYYLVTLPNGTATNVTDVAKLLNDKNTTKGTYKVQAIFSKDNLTAGVPNNLLLDANFLTYTIVGEDDATLAVSADTLYAGESLTITVKGTPGTEYFFNLTNVEIPQGQFVNTTWYDTGVDTEPKFTMPNNGEASFQAVIDAAAKDEASIRLFVSGETDAIEEITITVSAAQITATLGASSYFIGNEIEISGTSTAGKDLSFSIEGTNFKETLLEMNDEEFGKTWEADLVTKDVTEKDQANGKKLDVGTYTINIYQAEYADQTALETAIAAKVKPVKTVVVALKQPFISIIEAPEVIVQETDVEFVINAEATTAIKAYIFGTNYFLEVPAAQISADKDIKNQFTAKIDEEQTSAENMSAGQYFMVIQHPMYDGKFNIAAVGEKFYLNTSADATATGQFLFDVNERQTANAAQALCDALDTQNIDDMYVKYSFFVVGEDESFTISDIPATIAQGETLTISGVDTANAEKEVVVQMLSTAFAAVPKETVGSAAFIAVTTTVADDGTWEITLDTSDLNVDEYSLSVVINDATKKNVKINVVEAADKPDTPDTPDVPDTPDTPDTPTEPETPGFGALAALAGLGAVAVLLLRRE